MAVYLSKAEIPSITYLSWKYHRLAPFNGGGNVAVMFYFSFARYRSLAGGCLVSFYCRKDAQDMQRIPPSN